METLNRYPVDLVHMHSLDFHTYLPASSIPTLATLHLPIDWYPETIFSQRRKNFFLNCVSAAQEATCPPSRSVVPHICNGIDVSQFNWKMKKEPFVVGLGRICPEKGFHRALDAAHQAGVPMVLAGECFPYAKHIAYFEKEIAPRLDSQRRYIGPVGAAQKRELLAQASVLLVPSLVAETSSLVTMEALASGTPVVAFPAGAIPEMVINGKTGFLVNNETEMAEGIRKAKKLKSRDCRLRAEEKCNLGDMTNQYLSLYKTIVRGTREPMHQALPAGISWLADIR